MPKKTAITDYNAPLSEPFRLHFCHNDAVKAKAHQWELIPDFFYPMGIK
jgi:hypothetical protein